MVDDAQRPRSCRRLDSKMYSRLDSLKTAATGAVSGGLMNGTRSRGSSRPPTPTPSDAAKSGNPGDTFVYSTSMRRVEPPEEEKGILPSFTSPPKPRRKSSHGASTGHPFHHDAGAFAHTVRPATPSAHYAVNSVEFVVQNLGTHAAKGLESAGVPAIRALHGPNEFALEAKDPVWKKFLGQFYESPLNLLLLGSAGVSILVGNTDDAISITAAIVIVVTGALPDDLLSEAELTPSPWQSASCKSRDQKSRSKR